MIVVEKLREIGAKVRDVFLDLILRGEIWPEVVLRVATLRVLRLLVEAH